MSISIHTYIILNIGPSVKISKFFIGVPKACDWKKSSSPSRYGIFCTWHAPMKRVFRVSGSINGHVMIIRYGSA